MLVSYPITDGALAFVGPADILDGLGPADARGIQDQTGLRFCAKACAPSCALLSIMLEAMHWLATW